MPDEIPTSAAVSSPRPMPAPAAQPGAGPTAPATVAPQSVGMELRGRVMVNTALNLLEQAAAMLGGSRSEDGADVLSAVLKLRKRFGAVSRDLTQQDAKLIASRAAPVSAPPQQGPMGMPQMARRRMASMGMGGGQGG